MRHRLRHERAGGSLALALFLALELLREQHPAVLVALGERLRRDRSQSCDAVSLDELAFAIRRGLRQGASLRKRSPVRVTSAARPTALDQRSPPACKKAPPSRRAFLRFGDRGDLVLKVMASGGSAWPRWEAVMALATLVAGLDPSASAVKRSAAQRVGLSLYGNNVVVRVNLELVRPATCAGIEERRHRVTITDGEGDPAAVDATREPTRFHAATLAA